MQGQFSQTNAFASLYGLWFGLWWILGFLLMTAGTGSPLCQTGLWLNVLFAPIVGIWLARRFEREVRPDGFVTFGRAYVFSLLMYLYATLLLALVAYVWFAWVDRGHFVEANIAQMQSEPMKGVLESEPLRSEIEALLSASGFKSLEEMMRSVTPLVVCANVMFYNIIMAFVLSVPTAWMSKSKF